jgi:hypothetical protein
MDSSETVLTWAVFIWVLVSTFFMSGVEDRIVKKLKSILGEKANVLEKNTFSNPLQSYRNMVFFFRYKLDAATPEEVTKLIRRGRYLNVFHFFQLALIFVFVILWSESYVK